MIDALVRFAEKIYYKNYPDISTFVLGQYPRFIYRATVSTDENTVPVFYFHEVIKEEFEKKLIYLIENEYESLNSQELFEIISGKRKDSRKKIVLSFDDGHISLWRIAYPLLKKYNLNAIAFVCPGAHEYLESHGEDFDRSICSWEELRQMHASGVVDIQSHSYNHDLVFTSLRAKTYLNPSYSSYFIDNVETNGSVLRLNDSLSLTPLKTVSNGENISDYYGLPLLRIRPRMVAERNIVISNEVLECVKQLSKKYKENGCFSQAVLRKELLNEFKKKSIKDLGYMMSDSEHRETIIHDLVRSKESIEENIPFAKVEHFCAPWFMINDKTTIPTLEEAGFKTAFLGERCYGAGDGLSNYAVKKIPRLGERYIYLLPGEKRKNVINCLIENYM